MKKAFILGHLGMGDQFFIVGMVRYLSTIYDEILLVCKDNTKKNVEQIYSDDSSIQFLSIKHDSEISPSYGYNKTFFSTRFKDYDKFLMGFHKHGIRATYGAGKQLYDLPFSFYDDINIPCQVFWDYFHVNNTENSRFLFNKLLDKNINEFIFVHNTSSGGEVFTDDYIIDKFKIDKHKTFIVNPCKCLYEPEDKYYELAKTFLDHPILDYSILIEQANKIIISDSSFLCLSIHLEIKTDDCFIYCRTGPSYNYSYGHLWSDKYKPRSDKFKKFIQIS